VELLTKNSGNNSKQNNPGEKETAARKDRSPAPERSPEKSSLEILLTTVT
jgi:hypothetical protein